MAAWNLDVLSGLVQRLGAGLDALRQGEMDNATSFATQKELTTIAEEFVATTSDPAQSVKNLARGYTASVALKICLDLDLVHGFPDDGGHVTLSDLAEGMKVDEAVLGTVLNLLSNHGVFKNRGPSQWSHSARSMTLLKPSFNDLMSSLLNESFKSCFTLPKTLQKSHYQLPSPGHTAFNEYYHTDMDFYKYCATQDIVIGARFQRAMEEVASASLRFFEAAYPIQQLANFSLIVDVAGGAGYTSMFLAERLPGQQFLVCDYASVVEQGKAQCPMHLRARIRYVAHDMFQQYDALSAGWEERRVFLLKQVLHDWSDAQCMSILSNVLDVLETGDLLLIVDSVKPRENVSMSTSMSELLVMSTFGGRHRTYAELEALVRAARADIFIRTSFANAGQYDDFKVLEVQISGDGR